MATNTLVGGTYYNMYQVHPLIRDNKFNPPARNLFRNNVLLEDAVMQQANGILGHTGSYGIYAGSGAAVRKVGGYITPTSAGWGTFSDDISIFGDASAVPKDTVDLQGTSWLAEEEATKGNSFLQSVENHLMYGTNGPSSDTYVSNAGVSTTPTALPEKYAGFAPRFKTPDNSDGSYDPRNPDPSTAAQKGVYDMGGSGTDTTSIWFVRWGRRACSLITPMNDPQYGLKSEDKGLVREQQVDSTSHQASGQYRWIYLREYEWKHGLSVYPGNMQGNNVARIRNIETSLTFNNAGLKTLIYQVIREYFNSDLDGLRIYVPPRMMTIFDVLFEAKQNIQFTLANPYELSPDQWAGKIFIRQCRCISERETAVTAV